MFSKTDIEKLAIAGVLSEDGEITDYVKALAALESVYFAKQLPDTEEGFEVLFEALEEDDRPRGHFMPEDITWVEDQLEQGNQAAWFCARVTVSDPDSGEVGIDYLGACSYESFEDFVSKENPYLKDMIETASQELIEKLP